MRLADFVLILEQILRKVFQGKLNFVPIAPGYEMVIFTYNASTQSHFE